MNNGFYLAAILNVFFILGMIFVNEIDNLYLSIIWAIVMLVNSIYLVVKLREIKKT